MPPRLPRWAPTLSGPSIPPRSPLFLDVFLPWAASPSRPLRPSRRGIFGEALGYYFKKVPPKARVEPGKDASPKEREEREGESSGQPNAQGTSGDGGAGSAHPQEGRSGSYLDSIAGRLVFRDSQTAQSQEYEDSEDARRRRRRELHGIYRKSWRQRLTQQRLAREQPSEDETAGIDTRRDSGRHLATPHENERFARHPRPVTWASLVRMRPTDRDHSLPQASRVIRDRGDLASSLFFELRHVYVKTASAQEDFFLPSFRSHTDYRMRLPIWSTQSIPCRRRMSSLSTPDTPTTPPPSEAVHAADMVHRILRRSSNPNASDLGWAILAHPILQTSTFFSAAQEQSNRMANAWHGNPLQNCLRALRLGPLADRRRAIRHVTPQDRPLPWALRCWPPRPNVMDPRDPDELLCRYHFRLLRLSPENASSLDSVADLHDIKTACEDDKLLCYVSLRAYMNLTIAYWEQLRLSDDPWALVQLIESFLVATPGLHPDAWTLDLLSRALFHRPHRFRLEGAGRSAPDLNTAAVSLVPVHPDSSLDPALQSDETGPGTRISTKTFDAMVSSREKHTSPHLLLPTSPVINAHQAALKQVFMIVHAFKHRHTITALNTTWLRLAKHASVAEDAHQARIAWEGWWTSWSEISDRPRTWSLKVNTTRGTKRVTTFRRSGTMFRKFQPCLRVYAEKGWIEENAQWKEGEELRDKWVWKGKGGQEAKRRKRETRHLAYAAAELLKGLLDVDEAPRGGETEGAIAESDGAAIDLKLEALGEADHLPGLDAWTPVRLGEKL